MSEKQQVKSKIKFARCDGIKFVGLDISNSLVKDYIHKQIVVKTGAGEDDWHLEEVPTCVGEHDIHKEIQEEAKRCNLKALIAQVLRTGDESLLHQKDVVQFGDITGVPTDVITAQKMARKAQAITGNLPDALRGKSYEELMAMDPKELLAAYGVKAVQFKPDEKAVEKPVESEVRENGK